LVTDNTTNYAILSTSTTSRNNIDSIVTSGDSSTISGGTLGTQIFKITLYNPIIKNLNHQTMDYSSTEPVNREITIGFEYFEFVIYKPDNSNIPLF